MDFEIGLCLQIKELKSRLLQEENTAGSGVSVKEEEITTMPADSEEKTMEQSKSDPPSETSNINPSSESSEEDHLNYECFNNNSDDCGVGGTAASLLQVDMKDGSSDSDGSSAILNEDTMYLPSSMNCFQFQKPYHHAQYVKTEEHTCLSADEACNFFSDEQAPTLQWYCPEQWS